MKAPQTGGENKEQMCEKRLYFLAFFLEMRFDPSRSLQSATHVGEIKNRNKCQKLLVNDFNVSLFLKCLGFFCIWLHCSS